MSEKIYGALTDEFMRVMRNWARYVTGSDHAGVCISSIYGLGVRIDRSPETNINTIPGDALTVYDALNGVPMRYRQVVEQFWQHEGASLRWHARKRNIDYHTFEAWVIKGHELLKQELARRKQTPASHAPESLAIA